MSIRTDLWSISPDKRSIWSDLETLESTFKVLHILELWLLWISANPFLIVFNPLNNPRLTPVFNHTKVKLNNG